MLKPGSKVELISTVCVHAEWGCEEFLVPGVMWTELQSFAHSWPGSKPVRCYQWSLPHCCVQCCMFGPALSFIIEAGSMSIQKLLDLLLLGSRSCAFWAFRWHLFVWDLSTLVCNAFNFRTDSHVIRSVPLSSLHRAGALSVNTISCCGTDTANHLSRNLNSVEFSRIYIIFQHPSLDSLRYSLERWVFRCFAVLPAFRSVTYTKTGN